MPDISGNVSIKYKGREIQNPTLRNVISFVRPLFGGLLFLMMLVPWVALMILLVILSPVLILLHLALRADGRKGFVYRSRTTGNLSSKINIDSFRKGPSRY